MPLSSSLLVMSQRALQSTAMGVHINYYPAFGLSITAGSQTWGFSSHVVGQLITCGSAAAFDQRKDVNMTKTWSL